MCTKPNVYRFECTALQDYTCCTGDEVVEVSCCTLKKRGQRLELALFFYFQTDTIPALGTSLDYGQFFKSDADCPKPYRVCYDIDSFYNSVNVFGEPLTIFDCPGSDNNGTACSEDYETEVSPLN